MDLTAILSNPSTFAGYLGAQTSQTPSDAASVASFVEGGGEVTADLQNLAIPTKQNQDTSSSMLSYVNNALGTVNGWATSLAGLYTTIKPAVISTKQASSAQPIVGIQSPAKDSANTIVISPNTGTNQGSTIGGQDNSMLLWIGVGFFAVMLILVMKGK